MRRLRTEEYIVFLLIGFLAAFTTFSITLYAHSDDLLALIDYLLFAQSDKLIKYPIRTRYGQYYQGRNFLGKAQSINYDHYIEYDDFDFRKPDSLTYQNRTFANQTQIFYRFPRQTSLAALLLIFHSCQDSASNWFHTPERQRIIGAAIDLGYGCLVFQSTNQTTGCWANEADIYENRDIQMVSQGLHGFYTEYPELGNVNILSVDQ